MAKKTSNTKPARRTNHSNRSPVSAIDWSLIANAYAITSAALLRKSAAELEALAAAEHLDPAEKVRKLHGILAGDAASAFVGSQDIRDALRRAG